MGRNLFGTLQVVGEEKFEDEKIIILLDSFLLSQAEVVTESAVRVIRCREYVVIHDTLNKKAVWLLK